LHPQREAGAEVPEVAGADSGSKENAADARAQSTARGRGRKKD